MVGWSRISAGLTLAAAPALMKPFSTIDLSTTPERAARGLDVGGRRIIGRRLDQAGDDRRFAEAELLRAVAEERPRGGVDAIGAAAEIDPVQIEFEDLVLGELALERQRQHASLILRPKVRLLVRKMLRASCWVMVEPPCRQWPLSMPHLERAGDADRIDADVAAEALVLDRDHRRAHLGGIWS